MTTFGRRSTARWSSIGAAVNRLLTTSRRRSTALSFSITFAALPPIAALILVFALAGIAQTTNGLLTGRVLDPTGAVIPKATITVTDLGTNAVRNANSDEHGRYIIPQLPPAKYRVVVSKEGFAPSERPDLQIHVNEEATIDFKLIVGTSVQRVEVTATAPPLNTTSATLGDVVDHETTVDLPLNGRQFTDLTLLSPGAAPVEGPQQGSKTIALGAGAISPSVSGQRPQQNNFTMDGVMNNNIYTNIWAISPPPDALDEFNVQSHITDAEFATTSGANVNIATRSGTDTVHGDFWEFIRNDVLDAQTFPASSRLPYRQNQYGFYVGGPVRVPYFDGRKNTWFSAYWEGFRYNKSQAALGNTFTSAMKAGDFSAFLGAPLGVTDDLGNPEYKNEIYDPATTATDPKNPSLTVRTPFTNNMIPPGRLNPAAALVLAKYYPAPNLNVAPNVLPNLSFTGITAIASDVYGIRLDHRFGNNDTVFGRYNRDNATQSTPEGLPGYLHSVINYAQQLVFGYTHLFGSTAVLQVHFADTHTNIANFDAPAGAAFVTSVNWQLVQPAKYGISLGPGVSISNGFSGVSQSDTINGPQNNYEYHADYSKVLGAHTLGAGFLYYHIHSITDGWNFGANFTQNATAQGGLSTTGFGPASFFLGLPDNYSAWVGATGINQSVRWYGGYAQDNWQITRRLALTLAFRYDFISPPNYNGRTIGSLDAVTGKFCVNQAVSPAFSQATCPSGYFYPQHDGMQPRLGIAFKASDHTVIRTAVALLDDHNNSLAQENQDERLSWPTSYEPIVTNQNRGLPNLYFNAFPSAASFFAGGTANPFASYAANPNNKIPYSVEYNLGVERQLSNSLLLKMDYVGSVSHHLFVNLTGNTAPTPGPGTVLSREPYPQYGGPFPYDWNEGYSDYNGLQAQLKESLSHGLFFNVSYTYSKTMDVQSTAQSGGPENYYNLRQNYGPADFDRRQFLVVSSVYSLPFGHGKDLLHNASGIVEALAGDWNLGAIGSMVSGAPFNALAGSDVANVGGSNQRAQRTGASPYLRGRFTTTSKPWLNPVGFALPANYTWGSESRNDLVGPPSKDLDLSVFKDIPLKEQLKLQFRSEFFNVFNHSNYSTPSSTVTSSSFGLITSTASAGRDLQFALKVMF